MDGVAAAGAWLSRRRVARTHLPTPGRAGASRAHRAPSGGPHGRFRRARPAQRQPTPFDLDSSKLKAYRDLYLWPIEIKDENMGADCQLNLIGEPRAWPRRLLRLIRDRESVRTETNSGGRLQRADRVTLRTLPVDNQRTETPRGRTLRGNRR